MALSINEANRAVANKLAAAVCRLTDVVPAHTVIPELEPHVLLHAGPPLAFADMTDPMRGSCVGAVLFEGWAASEDRALDLLEQGRITFIPCHHAGAVGPMGGITSPRMPVLIAENTEHGNRAFCTLNEGIGRVLRFGAFGPDVIERLRWMQSELGPALSRALRPDPVPLNPLIARAITMGDEFHQRFVPDRGPSPVDVMIDTAGASLALALRQMVLRIFSAKFAGMHKDA